MGTFQRRSSARSTRISIDYSSTVREAPFAAHTTTALLLREFHRNCLTAAQFSSAPSGFWSSRSVEDPWTPATCGMNWLFSPEGETSRMDLATAISFGSLAEVTNIGIETCAAAVRTVVEPRRYSPGENARIALISL